MAESDDERAYAIERMRGVTAMNEGDDDEAGVAFRRAAELAPDQADPWALLAVLAIRRDDWAAAETAMWAALDRDPRHLGVLRGLATAMKRTDRFAEAAAIYDRLLEISPDDATARHLRAAARGENPPAAPPEYSRVVFDDFAARFDDELIDLDYQVPELLAAAVADRGAAVALDLGCGTGLVGVAIRRRVGELHGVDLSRGMIEQALEKDVYDRLVIGDALDELEQAEAPRFDLITAGDVLVYIGALERLFAAVARRLAPGGRFAFTVERGPDDEPGYQLRPSARYVHGRAYVERQAAAHHLAIERCEPAPLRREKDAAVEGLVVVLRRGAG